MQGFTLIELIITLVILVMLASIGIPPFLDFIRNQNVKRGGYEVMANLSYARSEAIKRNGSVTITPVDASNWEDGWSITSGGNTLRVLNELEGLDITGPAAAFSFTGNGRTSSVSFEICDENRSASVEKRTVSLDSVGRAENEITGICGP
ncbi:MAG: GspH/FimT family pseudopilin [Candidatus Sedimenticola sp. (ex Thyasira tokunagai)]